MSDEATESMMRSLARLPVPSYNDAVRAQTTLAIAIELVAPLRAKNLAGLRLDQHLVRSRPGPGAVIHLVISSGESRTRTRSSSNCRRTWSAFLSLTCKNSDPFL
jgi:hypothetical protein